MALVQTIVTNYAKTIISAYVEQHVKKSDLFGQQQERLVLFVTFRVLVSGALKLEKIIKNMFIVWNS